MATATGGGVRVIPLGGAGRDRQEHVRDRARGPDGGHRLRHHLPQERPDGRGHRPARLRLRGRAARPARGAHPHPRPRGPHRRGALPAARGRARCRSTARRFTLALLRPKLDEHRLLDDAELVEVALGRAIQIGPFEAEFVPLTHSTPGLRRRGARTAPAARWCTPGDFGIEYAPGRRPAQRPARPGPAGRPRRPPAAGRLDQRRGGPAAVAACPTRDVRERAGAHLRHRPRARAGHHLLLAHPPRAAGAGRRVRRRAGRRARGPLAHAQRRRSRAT